MIFMKIDSIFADPILQEIRIFFEIWWSKNINTTKIPKHSLEKLLHECC